MKKESSLHSQVVAALQEVYDPELPVDIYSLGLIYDITIDSEQQKVAILMTLTTPNCPAADLIPEEIKKSVSQVEGIEDVAVTITFDPPYNPAKMSEEAKIALGWVDVF